MKRRKKRMKTTLDLYGHTIDICSNGTGFIDPWSCKFASDIDLSLMVTSDIGEFMLIDGSHIYKFDSFNDARELHSFIDNGIFDSWEQFEKEWLKPRLKKRWLRVDGTLEDSINSLIKHKMRDEVWESFPQKERREVYEYLKTLSREEKEKWYEDKIKELGIKPVEKPSIDSLRDL